VDENRTGCDPRRWDMKRNRGITWIGLPIFLAGLLGCQDSPTSPARGEFDQPSLALFEVVVLNATGEDLYFSVEFGEALTEEGANVPQKVVQLGFVRAQGEEEFVLEPSLVENAPARFYAAFASGDDMVESKWMWLDQHGAVELVITPLRVIRTDDPDLDLDEACPWRLDGIC
jgi:hypothetical protein